MFSIEKDFTEYPVILNVTMLKEILGIQDNKIYSLIRDGEIKAAKIGKDYKIPKKSLVDYLNKIMA